MCGWPASEYLTSRLCLAAGRAGSSDDPPPAEAAAPTVGLVEAARGLLELAAEVLDAAFGPIGIDGGGVTICGASLTGHAPAGNESSAAYTTFGSNVALPGPCSMNERMPDF